MRISNSLAALQANPSLVKQQEGNKPQTNHQASPDNRVTLKTTATDPDTYERIIQGEVLRNRRDKDHQVDNRSRVLQSEVAINNPANSAATRRAIDQFLQASPLTTDESETTGNHIDVYA